METLIRDLERAAAKLTEGDPNTTISDGMLGYWTLVKARLHDKEIKHLIGLAQGKLDLSRLREHLIELYPRGSYERQGLTTRTLTTTTTSLQLSPGTRTSLMRMASWMPATTTRHGSRTGTAGQTRSSTTRLPMRTLKSWSTTPSLRTRSWQLPRKPPMTPMLPWSLPT